MHRDILLAALEGLEARAKAIAAQIAEVRAQLGEEAPEEQPQKRTHNISQAGRERIAEAQRKKWREYRKKQQEVLTK